MKATVLVRPKQGILDPQGEAVESALGHLGFAVRGARVGKVVDLEVEATTDGVTAGAFRIVTDPINVTMPICVPARLTSNGAGTNLAEALCLRASRSNTSWYSSGISV